MKSAIDELGLENRRADEVEARAMHAEALLAQGKLADARDMVEKASALRATDWLARLRLSASSPSWKRLEATTRRTSTSRRSHDRSAASGCVVCQAEVGEVLSRLDSRHSLRSGRQAQPRLLLTDRSV